MRRPLTIVAVIALAGAAGVAAKPKAAKVAPPAAAPAPPLPTSVDRLDITQFEAVIKGIGRQKSFGRVDGAVPAIVETMPLGVMGRTALLPKSETKMFPPASTARLRG